MINQLSDGLVVEEAELARVALHGRILRCSRGGNPPECPLYELRCRSIEERLAWIDSRTDDEVKSLYRHHTTCSRDENAVCVA